MVGLGRLAQAQESLLEQVPAGRAPLEFFLVLAKHVSSARLHPAGVAGHHLSVDDHLEPFVIEANGALSADELRGHAVAVVVDSHAEVPADLSLEALV